MHLNMRIIPISASSISSEKLHKRSSTRPHVPSSVESLVVTLLSIGLSIRMVEIAHKGKIPAPQSPAGHASVSGALVRVNPTLEKYKMLTISP